MKPFLLIIGLFLNISGFCQPTLSGTISLCPDFYPGVSVSGRMVYKNYQEKKKGTCPSELDTLIVQIKVLNQQGFFLETYSDKSGFYLLELPHSGQYVMDLSIGYYFFSTFVIDIDSAHQVFNPCLSDSILDAQFLTKIPYDRYTAEADIRAGIIRIISLNSLFSGGCKLDVLESYHFDIVERRYGFEFFGDFIEENIPEIYLRQREEEYNAVVYQYLNSLHQFNIREAIEWDLYDMRRKVLEGWHKNKY